MLLRISIYLNALVFLMLIPMLEVGSTHVFNQDWPAHARLHEVWQLVTNGLLAILTLVLSRDARTRNVGGVIALAINAGFLAALAGADSYGGSMAHSDGSELLLAGINPASAIITCLSLAILVGMFGVRKPERATA